MENRDRAIEHLAEALYLFANVRNPGDTPTIPLHLGSTDGSRTLHLTPRQAEALADAVDSMNDYAADEHPVDRALQGLADKITEAVTARPGGPIGERIRSGEWSAAAVAQNDTDLWDQVNDLFDDLDLRTLTKDVLDNAHADNLTVSRALDSFFGEIADPYADEDDA